MIRSTEYAVIGKGLIGSAAARHLAEAGREVVLVGPDEPSAPAQHGGVFGSHHDAGRITRRIDRDPVWAQLAHRSIERYGELEAATGIRFHHPGELLCVGTPGSHMRDEMLATATMLEVPCVTTPQIHGALQLPAGSELCGETQPAGHIEPRRLVQAQALAALAAGARVIRSPVWALREADTGVRLILDDGSELLAERVLVCAGAFAAPVGLVTGLPLWTEGRTIVLARVEDELGAHMAGLPCLIMDAPGTELPDLYLMPPLRYPDGHRYVKIGSGSIEHRIDELEALQQWFRHPAPPDDVERLSNALFGLLPALEGTELRSDTCAVTRTVSGLPVIDWTSAGRIAVALGGNGKAAKSSDEIGRLGAALLADTALPEELAPFRI